MLGPMKIQHRKSILVI